MFVNILLICKWASIVSKQSGSFLRTETTVLVTPHVRLTELYPLSGIWKASLTFQKVIYLFSHSSSLVKSCVTITGVNTALNYAVYLGSCLC